MTFTTLNFISRKGVNESKRITFCEYNAVTHYHDAAVLRATGDDVVIVRAKLDVQDGARVAAHGGAGQVNASCLHRERR